MNRHLSNRLFSLAMAFVVTFGLAGGIHSLAANEAAAAVQEAQAAAQAAQAGHMAHSAGLPPCAKV